MTIDQSSTAGRRRLWLFVIAPLILIVAGVGAAVALLFRGSPPAQSPLQLALLPPATLSLPSTSDYPFGLALAPDGRRLVFPAQRAGDEAAQLWLRDLTRDDLQPLSGTEDAALPFWSPDGAHVGFFASGKLRVFVFATGDVHELAPAPSPRGAVWHPNGDIVFAPAGEGGLMRRRPSGTIEPLTSPDSAAELGHGFPALAGGGSHLVFYVRSMEAVREGLWIAPFDNPSARKRLVKSDAQGLAVDQSLVYSSEGALVAQHLDLQRLALVGAPTLLGSIVGRSPQNQLFATSGGDTLVFGTPASGLRELRWMDARGAQVATIGEPMIAGEVRIAPSGSTVAVARTDPQLHTLDIWTYEAARPLPRRISLSIDADDSPAWSADGRRLVWVTGRRAVTLRDALAASPDVTLRKFDGPVSVSDWSDPRAIVVSETRAGSGSDILLLAPDQDGPPRVYAQSPFNETHGVVAPDRRWMAYASDESGAFEIYADAYPLPGRRARLTVGGGAEPRWSRDGTRVYFRRGTAIHVVDVTVADGALEAASSQHLFDAGADIRSFDVAGDGERFLLNLPIPDSAPKPMTVIVNVSRRLPPPPARR
jgi:eukaryotic-like serine/threonine-protein kinase